MLVLPKPMRLWGPLLMASLGRKTGHLIKNTGHLAKCAVACPGGPCECIPSGGGLALVGDAMVTISGSSGLVGKPINIGGCNSCSAGTPPNIDGTYVVACAGDDTYCLWTYVCTDGITDAYYETRLVLRWTQLNLNQYQLQLIMFSNSVAIAAGSPNPAPALTLSSCPPYACAATGQGRETFFRSTAPTETCSGTAYNQCPSGSVSLHSNTITSVGGANNGYNFTPLTISVAV